MSIQMSNGSILYDCLFLSLHVFFYLPPVVQSAQGPKQKRHCLFNQGQQCITVSFHWYSTLLATLLTTVYTSGYSVFAGTITVWQIAHQGHLSEAGRQESYKEGGHLSPCLPSLGCHASVSMTTRKPLNLQWEMANPGAALEISLWHSPPFSTSLPKPHTPFTRMCTLLSPFSTPYSGRSKWLLQWQRPPAGPYLGK